jgi:hypothetical protein
MRERQFKAWRFEDFRRATHCVATYEGSEVVGAGFKPAPTRAR